MRYKYMLSDKQCQPCGIFQPEENTHVPGGFEVHECYRQCGKTVAFCDQCYKDHHEGGYNNCITDVSGCEHPACKAKCNA